MERLEGDVELVRAIELGKVRDDEFRVLLSLGDALEADNLGHLDLLPETTLLVLAKARHIANREVVRTSDGDLSGGTVIQVGHALDLCKGDIVAVFEAMSGLVKSGHQAGLVDVNDDAGVGGFTSSIADGELLSEIAKDGCEKTVGLGTDEVDALLVAVFTDGNLVFKRRVCQDDDLILIKL